MKRLFLFVILTFSFLGEGCKSNDGQPPPPVTGPLFPLAFGNTWIVQTTDYRFDGVILATYFDTTRVVDTIRINGEKWYVERFTSSRIPPRVAIDTVTVRSDGFWLHSSLLVSGANLFYKYPGPVGEGAFVSLGGGFRIAIVNNDLTQDFPIGGREHCYEYEIIYTNVTTRKFDIFAPNIGFVKETTYDSLQTPPSVYVSKKQDLLSYTLR